MPAPVPSLAGKRCFVTGAASGIGRATALAAARRGADLYLTDIAAAGLEETSGMVRAAAGKVTFTRAADVTDHEAVVAMAEEIHAAYGCMDVVMNVAGISIWGAIERLDHDHWQRAIDIDLVGPISVLECFVPPMIAAGRGGHVVNVSSAAGLLGLPWHAPYSAAKFGLRGVSEVLRFDLRPHNIGVSLVCPGGVKTPLVGTVEIVGVDAERPRAEEAEKPLRAPRGQPRARRREDPRRDREEPLPRFHFARHPPPFGLQRWFPPAYELVMRELNRRLVAVAA